MKVPATQELQPVGAGHGVLLCFVWGFGDGSVPKHTRHIPLASVRTVLPLGHRLPGLQAFFCQPYAVYIRAHGFAHSHTVFCTPHRHREGWR